MRPLTANGETATDSL